MHRLRYHNAQCSFFFILTRTFHIISHHADPPADTAPASMDNALASQSDRGQNNQQKQEIPAMCSTPVSKKSIPNTALPPTAPPQTFNSSKVVIHSQRSRQVPYSRSGGQYPFHPPPQNLRSFVHPCTSSNPYH